MLGDNLEKCEPSRSDIEGRGLYLMRRLSTVGTFGLCAGRSGPAVLAVADCGRHGGFKSFRRTDRE